MGTPYCRPAGGLKGTGWSKMATGHISVNIEDILTKFGVQVSCVNSSLYLRSGRTVIVYCILCKYVIVMCTCIGHIHLLAIMCFLNCLHNNVRMYDILWAYSA